MSKKRWYQVNNTDLRMAKNVFLWYINVKKLTKKFLDSDSDAEKELTQNT